jgi:hypothetical protein
MFGCRNPILSVRFPPFFKFRPDGKKLGFFFLVKRPSLYFLEVDDILFGDVKRLFQTLVVVPVIIGGQPVLDTIRWRKQIERSG